MRHQHLGAHGSRVAKGQLRIGELFVHESIIGTLFEGTPLAAARVGDFDTIVPAIEGWARVTGHNTIFVDDRDPLAHGFLLNGRRRDDVMLILKNARVFDTDHERDDGRYSIVIDGDTIREVTREPVEAHGAKVIDVGGKTVMPGRSTATCM